MGHAPLLLFLLSNLTFCGFFYDTHSKPRKVQNYHNINKNAVRGVKVGANRC